MSLGLIVDTTIQGIHLGMVDLESDDLQNAFVWQGSHTKTHGSSATIVQLLSEGLSQLNAKQADISRVMIAHGPGSFTGIKIGLAFCYGLKRARPSLEVTGFSALAAIARQQQSCTGQATGAILASTQTQGFAAIAGQSDHFDIDEFSFTFSNETLTQILGSAKQFLLVKPWPSFEEYFAKTSPNERLVVLDDEKRAELILKSASLQLTASKENFHSEALKPNYLRKSRAEERALEKRI